MVPEMPTGRSPGAPPAQHAAAGPRLEIDRVWVTYGDVVAVRDASLHITAGTTVAIIGPNGSGKSTLLSTISGLVHPSRGSISVADTDGRHSRNAVAHVLQTTVANQSVPLTVLETVRMGAYGHRGMIGRLTAEDRTAVEDAIHRMRIDDLRNRQLHELSGGQRQRAYVAQGLAQRAGILLLDEPISGLDIVSQEVITQVVDEERDRGRIVLLTTHDVGTARLADVAVLIATDIIAAGAPEGALTPELLSQAYGGHVHVLEDGTLVLDDPHTHDHRHENQLGS